MSVPTHPAFRATAFFAADLEARAAAAGI